MSVVVALLPESPPTLNFILPSLEEVSIRPAAKSGQLQDLTEYLKYPGIFHTVPNPIRGS